jgi:phage tail tape-measure protein
MSTGGAATGAVAGAAVGSVVPGIGTAIGAVAGAIIGGSDDSPPPPPDHNPALVAMATASRDAAIAQSNAQVTIAQTQAATQQLGILKHSQDAQFQTLAWLTTQLDSHDAKLQIAVENARISSQHESDHHVEAMKGLGNDARELEIAAAERGKL